MISPKWLDLLALLQQKTYEFAAMEELSDLLESRFAFLKSQFSNISHTNEPSHIDWLEHEAFTAVLSDVMRDQAFTQEELGVIFDLLMSAQLCQLALTVLNNHKAKFADDDYALKSGIALFQLGEYEQATQSIEQAVTANPDNHLALFHLGYLQIFAGNAGKAQEYFKACIEKAPDFVGAHQNIAGCYYQDSEFESAAERCEQIYCLDPAFTPAYITAISSYLALSQLDKAQLWLARAEQNGIDSVELPRLSGIVAYQSGNHEKAVAELTLYLESNPTNFDVLTIRAQALAAAEQWLSLIDDLEQLLEIDPYDSWCLEQLFLAHYHTQGWAEAERTMAELAKLSAHYKVTYRDKIDEIRQQQAIPLKEE